jgi:Ca2+/H+ antiporter, TMEM165/GDT1 family
MEAFLVSTGIVALAGMGDKTQLLAMLLVARFCQPWSVAAGIFVAALANHALAGAVGGWMTTVVGAHLMTWILGGSFVAMAAWTLVPDKLDDEDAAVARGHLGVFGTTMITFFLAEMGGKTQVATVMLAARLQAWTPVVAGATVGLMLANVPAVWFGERLVRRIPLRLVQLVSAAIFFVLGAAILVGVR